MEVKKINLIGKGTAFIDILPLADVHVGSAEADINYIKFLINAVRDSESTYAILGGDMIDCALKGSVSDVYSATMNPQKQMDYVVDLLEPIKHKILLIMDGNHERRIRKDTSISPAWEIANRLDIADKYATTTALLNVAVGCYGTEQLYSIYVTHGSGGGALPGGKLNKLTRAVQIVDADIYIQGHTHSPMIYRQAFFRTLSNGNTEMVDKLFVNTGSTLSYGGYGDVFGFAPSSLSYPVISLWTAEKKATATL